MQGIDPAKNIAEKASENGVPTLAEFFGEKFAEKIVGEMGYPAIVFARNVMPHVADLNDFAEGVARCCDDGTLTIIEVHYSGTIQEELHYDSIYHEHLHYFTLKSVGAVLERHGLHVYDLMESPISGGSIVLYAMKSEKAKTDRLIQFEKKENEKGFNNFNGWKKFAETADEHRKQLILAIEKELSANHTIIGYGASARSSTMLNFCDVDHAMIERIVDQNELKQGRLTPGTHIPICSPDELAGKEPDTILLLAWNFRDEIMGVLENRFGFHGNVIIPLPYPVKEIRV